MQTSAGDTVTRSLYVNNMSDGKIPFLQNRELIHHL